MARNIRIPQPSWLSTFLKWWHYELSQVTPYWLKKNIVSRPNKAALSFSDETFILTYTEGSSGKFKTQVFKEISALKHEINRFRKKRNFLIGFRLVQGQYFKRDMVLPENARFKVDQILDLDIERSTPFKHSQIYSDYSIDNEEKGKLYISHYILKKSIIDDLMERVKELDIQPDFIDAESSSSEGDVLPINFLQTKQNTDTGYSQLTLNHALAFLCLIACTFLVQQAYQRQSDALARLDTEISIAQRKAKKARTRLHNANKTKLLFENLNNKKRFSYTTLELWKEVTDKLPNTAWLNQFTVNGDKLQIIGYAKEAEQLIKILDQSSLFEDIKFLSPVTLDQRYKRERFIILCKIKQKAKQQLAQKERR